MPQGGQAYSNLHSNLYVVSCGLCPWSAASCAHQLACNPGSSRSCPVRDHDQCLPMATCHTAGATLPTDDNHPPHDGSATSASHTRHIRVLGHKQLMCTHQPLPQKKKPKCRLTTYVCIYPRTCCNNWSWACVNTKSSVVPADKAGCLSPTCHMHTAAMSCARRAACTPQALMYAASPPPPPMCGLWRPLRQTQPGEVWSACSRRVCRADGGTL